MEQIDLQSRHHRVLLVTDIHYCDRVWHGADRDRRAEALVEALNRQMEETPYDAILCLGDYSLDFWAWNEGGSYVNAPHVSFTRQFTDRYVPRFPVKPYLIPGNHEQYGDAKWRQITGLPRQFCLSYGDTLFLMCDTFAGDLDPAVHSDGTYTGIDTAFVQEALERWPDRQVVLCMHDLIPEKESEQAKRLIRSTPRIRCAFAGHVHISETILLDDSWGRLPLIHCGDFSYNLGSAHCNWGFQMLDLSHGFTTWYQQGRVSEPFPAE